MSIPTPTEEQKRIANHRLGHARVSAVAGSGKTETMIGLVYRNVLDGIDPQRLIVVMFNREAKIDFDHRLTRRFEAKGADRKGLQVRTFHSIGLKLCELFEKRGLLTPRTTETRSWRAEKMARSALKEAARVSKTRIPTESGELQEDFMAFIDLVKADVLAPEEVIEKTDLPGQMKPLFLEAYERFETAREREGVRFYADMIADPVRLLLHRSDLLPLVENRVDLIVCDEAQDMNPAQQKLIEYIAGDRASLVVVGDVDQCIYQWRGAYPQYLLSEFEQHFQPVARYQLSRTFRYGHRLSLAANHLIRHNREREDTFCISHESCPETQISVLWNEYDRQGRNVIQRIADQWIDEGHEWDELGILVRDNAAATGLILGMLSRDIPFNLRGHIRFLGNAPYADALLAVLHLVNGTLFTRPHKSRLVSLLRFPYTRISAERWSKVADRCLEECSLQPALEALLHSGIHEYAIEMQKKRLKWLIRLAQEGVSGMKKRHGGSPGRAVGGLLREYIGAMVADYEGAFTWIAANDQEKAQYLRVVNELIEFIERLELTLDELVDHMGGFEEKIRKAKHGISISTCHTAKGLEYEGVILYGLEQGVFPHARSAVEEERRLFYVAITRARKHLFLVSPRDLGLEEVLQGGSAPIEYREGGASQFLYEMEIPLSIQAGTRMESGKMESIGGLAPVVDPSMVNRYLDVLAPEAEKLKQKKQSGTKAGQRTARPRKIHHRKFGEGVVVAWKGDEYMQVQFNNRLSWFQVESTPFEVVN